MTSLKQTAANRKNSQKSTGARTPEGKARSSKNAITHGLTAERVVIDGEDAAAYEQLVKGLTEEYTAQHGAPGSLQGQLIILVANVLWRLRRAMMCEAAIFFYLHNRTRTNGDGGEKPPGAPQGAIEGSGRDHLLHLAARFRIPAPTEEDYRLANGGTAKPNGAGHDHGGQDKEPKTAEPDPEKEERDKVHSSMLCLGRSLTKDGSDNDALARLARYERDLVSRLERLLKLLAMPWGGLS